MLYCMKLQRALANNVTMLLKVTGHSANQMGKNCGISPRMIGHIKKLEANASIEIIERIADYYKIPAWLLLVDGLTESAFKQQNLKKLINNYLSSDEDGRKALESLAEREAYFSEQVKKPPSLKSPSSKKKYS